MAERRDRAPACKAKGARNVQTPERRQAKIAEGFRRMAQRSIEPDKSRYLRLAAMYEREIGLIGASRRAMDESAILLTKVAKLGR